MSTGGPGPTQAERWIIVVIVVAAAIAVMLAALGRFGIVISRFVEIVG